MSIADWLGLGKTISEPIKAVGDLYTTDKARLEGENKLQETMNKVTLSQIGVNKSLALSSNLFNSGWQPLLGWTAGLLILLFYGPQIVIATYLWTTLCINKNVIAPFPMKADDIINLVWLLFGFGGYSLIKRK